MVSLGRLGPYREGAKVEANMDASEIARQIQKSYAKRLGAGERVIVEMGYRRYYVSCPSSMSGKERSEEEKYKREYSAKLVCYDKCLARVCSENSFDEAIAELAQQLEVKL